VLQKSVSGKCFMNVRAIGGVFVRVILSAVFAGIFYTAWLVVAIPVTKLGIDSLILKAILWSSAPAVTALGFTTGVFIFELFAGTGGRDKFLNIFKWSLAGCAIGAGSIVWFGPMLIVFGMFLLGTASVAQREIIRLKRDKRNISCDS